MEWQRRACEACGRKPVFAPCLGCGKIVCESCARFELIGSGCGCVWPAYYCEACVMDPAVNPNAMFRDPPRRPGTGAGG